MNLRKQLAAITFFLLMASLAVDAQFSFIEPITNLCADGETPTTSFVGWEAYQTYDGTKDGERDTLHCIQLGELTYQATILESEIDISKPVFLHWQGAPVALQQDYLYNISMYASSMSAINLTDINYCDDGFCQGYGIAVQVPDDPEDGDTIAETRWHFQEFGQTFWGGDYAPACLPSEQFTTDQYITDIYLKFLFMPGFSEYSVYDLYLDYVWDMQLLTNDELPWYYAGDNSYSLGWGNYLALHDAALFPNLNNISYLELSPQPNTATQENITFFINQEATLTFQPYTDMRGALLEGSDEIRHTVSLVNNGGEFCMPFGFELVFEPGDRYIFNDGHLGMAWGTCMRFQPDSKLQIGAHAMLHYGEQGMGMLALQSGCEMLLSHHAELHINNTVRMFNEPWQTTIEDIHLFLNDGNQLVFGPFAHLENFSMNEEMKLVVHLNGGYLDLGNLSEEERKHIEVIYPEQNEELAVLQVLGNPALEQLQCTVHSMKEANTRVEIMDANGRLVMEMNGMLVSGFNQLSIDISSLSSGVYISRLSQGSAVVNMKFVKE